jgi:hypothetical protein
LGGSVASVAGERTIETDLALIGHQESWRAAADVLAVLRGRRPRSRGGGLRDQGRSEDRESRRIQLDSDRGQLRSTSGKTRYGLHDRQYLDSCFHRSGHQEDVRAGGSKPLRINVAHCWVLIQERVSVAVKHRLLGPQELA